VSVLTDSVASTAQRSTPQTCSFNMNHSHFRLHFDGQDGGLVYNEGLVDSMMVLTGLLIPPVKTKPH
jgi:hypothetical protein